MQVNIGGSMFNTLPEVFKVVVVKCNSCDIMQYHSVGYNQKYDISELHNNVSCLLYATMEETSAYRLHCSDVFGRVISDVCCVQWQGS